jgi:Histidine-specific methyltransferase, SAM-dependent/Predicted nucleotide-binding protein containing TIR-like domain
MDKAKVFIGSAGETRKLAVALQSLLEQAASVRVWDQRIFQPNHGNLANILKAVDEHDFACFLAPPTDTLTSRGEDQLVVRDNIILEYGLFLGRLGPNRVFLLHPRDTVITLPSDLDGVSFVKYKPIDSDNPAESVLAPAAKIVEDGIDEVGLRDVNVKRRYSPLLERGTVDRVGSISDAALYFSRKRHGYKEDIKNFILHGEVLPSMYYYATEEGAEFWLAMSSEPRYRFKSNSFRLLNKVAAQIADAVMSSNPRGKELDFISLGSGDGEKDHRLLTALVAANASLTYYPLDISDKLLVECIRNVQAQALDYANLKTKAILGDFIDLKLLRSVYEDRPSPNLFSLLGNTFGNTDEARIMNALRDSMYPGDFVLIEINSDVEELDAAESFLRDKLSLRYSCAPIAMLGHKVDLKKAGVREEDELSVFQCAKSSATYYSVLELDGRSIEDVPLEHIHRYPLDQFKVELADDLEVNVLLAEKYGNAAVVLGQKVD